MAFRASPGEGLMAITGYWDELLAVGVGIVVVDVLSDRVAAFLGQWVPADWVDITTEAAIGVGIFALGEYFAPSAWKVYTRLASFGAIGLAAAHTMKKLFGLGGEHSSGDLGSQSNPGVPQSSSEYWPYI